jgi:hypothetical protein
VGHTSLDRNEIVDRSSGNPVGAMVHRDLLAEPGRGGERVLR